MADNNDLNIFGYELNSVQNKKPTTEAGKRFVLYLCVGKELCAASGRNPATGGDSSFTQQYEFNGLAQQGVLIGTEYEKYIPFDDEPEYERNYPVRLKVMTSIMAASAVAATIGSMLIVTSVFEFFKNPENAVDMMKKGVSCMMLGPVLGVLSSVANVIRDAEGRKNNDIRSMSEYHAHAIASAVTLASLRELISVIGSIFAGQFKFDREFTNTVDRNDILKIGACWIPHRLNIKTMNMLNLFSVLGVDQDTITIHEQKNTIALRQQLVSRRINKFFIPGEFIENQSGWKAVQFGSTNMAAAGCEIMATYNALLALGKDMSSIEQMVDLISDFEEHGAELGGEFGSTPTSIRDYFVRHDYNVVYTLSRNPDVINKMGEDSDTIIITVYNSVYDASNMIHTVSVTKDENGYYTLHNGYKQNDNGEYIAFDSIDGKPIETLQEIVENMSGGNSAVIYVIGISKAEDMQE